MSERNPSGSGPERTRSEPEIIPPEIKREHAVARESRISINDQDGTRRVYVAQPGPFTIVLALAILGLIAAVMLIVLLSVALIWIPVVIVLIVAFVLSVTFRAVVAASGTGWRGADASGARYLMNSPPMFTISASTATL